MTSKISIIVLVALAFSSCAWVLDLDLDANGRHVLLAGTHLQFDAQKSAEDQLPSEPLYCNVTSSTQSVIFCQIVYSAPKLVFSFASDFIVAGEYNVIIKNTDGGVVVLTGIPSPIVLLVIPDIPSDKSTAFGPGLDGVVAGAEAPFTVQTKDRFGNLISYGGANVAATVSQGSNTISPTVTDNADGTYTVKYSVQVSGTWVVSVYVETIPIQASPFNAVMHAGPADALKSLGYGPGLEQAEAGTPGTFTVEARDQYGNKVVSGGSTVTATITLGATLPVVVPVIDNGDGTYTASYTVTVSATWVVRAYIGGILVKDAPFNVPVAAAHADPSHSEASGNGIISAKVGLLSSITVQSFDVYSNKVTKGGNAVVCSATHASGPVPCTVKDNGNGTYSVDYQTDKAGKWTIAIKMDDVHILKSPFSVKASNSGTG
jgi:hypothetical protein